MEKGFRDGKPGMVRNAESFHMKKLKKNGTVHLGDKYRTMNSRERGDQAVALYKDLNLKTENLKLMKKILYGSGKASLQNLPPGSYQDPNKHWQSIGLIKVCSTGTANSDKEVFWKGYKTQYFGAYENPRLLQETLLEGTLTINVYCKIFAPSV